MNFFLRVLQKNCTYLSSYFIYRKNMLNLTALLTVTVKIRSLYDYQLRLMQGVVPPPSGVDIANTIKYFSQTLLSK